MRINKKDILKVFNEAETQDDALVGICRLVFPNWDDIKHICGWPKASKPLWNFICNEFMKFDEIHAPDCMPGGAWLNNGFSANEDVPMEPWEISKKGVTVELI